MFWEELKIIPPLAESNREEGFLMFEKANNKLLNIAISETGLYEGAFGGIFTTDSELLPIRSFSIFMAILTPYYSNSENRDTIDEFIKKAEGVFNSGFGMISMQGEYERLVNNLDQLLKTLEK
ncbi:hypothetical protein MUB24_03475 [Lederbergia sp. NSJ-179]|uniref:hypothetical protein n=1 Tax=Lederbergia sp. NSJ-179 TaxID=2931402 RepID=UPI001FD3238F|nr:hypothetical protein [Lederbergia sp. NSJ-179]MCJ7839988.1 hypothetical protein [Lederbergia sp. NSJ-179]